MDFQDILANANTVPGYRADLYIRLHADVVWPAPDANSNNFSAAFTVSGVDQGFFKIPVSIVSGKVTFEQSSEGDVDNPSRNDNFSAYHSGYDPVTAYFLDQIEGQQCVVLVGEKKNCNEAGDPTYQVIGDKCQGVIIRSTFKNDGTAKGFTIVGSGFATSLPFTYDAAIPV